MKCQLSNNVKYKMRYCQNFLEKGSNSVMIKFKKI